MVARNEGIAAGGGCVQDERRAQKGWRALRATFSPETIRREQRRGGLLPAALRQMHGEEREKKMPEVIFGLEDGLSGRWQYRE